MPVQYKSLAAHFFPHHSLTIPKTPRSIAKLACNTLMELSWKSTKQLKRDSLRTGVRAHSSKNHQASQRAPAPSASYLSQLCSLYYFLPSCCSSPAVLSPLLSFPATTGRNSSGCCYKGKPLTVLFGQLSCSQLLNLTPPHQVKACPEPTGITCAPSTRASTSTKPVTRKYSCLQGGGLLSWDSTAELLSRPDRELV